MMGLSFGSDVPSVNVPDFGGGKPKKFDKDAGGGFNVVNWLFGANDGGLGYSKGTPIVGTFDEYTEAVATPNIDGTSGWSDWLGSLTGSVLSSVGAQDDVPKTNVHPASYGGGGEIAGVPLRHWALVALVSAGVYYWATK